MEATVSAEENTSRDDLAKEAAEARRADCRDHHEALIDAALEESFPASDPPSVARPACLDVPEKDGQR